MAYDSRTQMAKSIVLPLQESGISTVIVIDALDECETEECNSTILSAIGEFVSEIPKVKFFVTGRPERHILSGFRLPPVAQVTEVFALHEVEASRIDSDIGLFLRHKLLGPTDGEGKPDGWPTEACLDLLCERAAGLFAFAVATVEFINCWYGTPRGQLERILMSPEKSVYEGGARFRPGTTLDSLYMSILQGAFSPKVDPEVCSILGVEISEIDPKVRSVLGAVILAATPLSPSTIATLLGFDTKEVFPLLLSTHSLLILQDVDDPVEPFHKSFPDFLVDPTRCIDERFHVSPPDHHSELSVGCLMLMMRTLEKDMCELPGAVPNSEVADLHERIERCLDPALRYACKSWQKHLVDVHTTDTDNITAILHLFLAKKFLFWLEVLSVIGAAREAVDALEAVAKWLEVCRISALDVLPKSAFAETGCRRHRLLTLSTSASVS